MINKTFIFYWSNFYHYFQFIPSDMSMRYNNSFPTEKGIFYGHHDLSTLLLGKVPTKRSELVDTVEPTSS